MDRHVATGCLLLLSLLALVHGQALPHYNNHIYLGYISPFNFVRGFSHNARPYIYHSIRHRRSPMAPHNYNYMPAHYNSYNPSPYSYNYNYNPMFTHPFNMFHPLTNFPRFSLPFMTPYPYFSPSRPTYNNNNNNGYPTNNNNGYPTNNNHANVASDPFGSHFMKMMGFDFSKGPSFPTLPVTNGNNYNSNGFDYGNTKQSTSGNGQAYEKSYSKSYTMNSANGKGHMVMKDSSYVNDNGNVEMHNNPGQHYTMKADGTFVPDNSYNQK